MYNGLEAIICNLGLKKHDKARIISEVEVICNGAMVSAVQAASKLEEANSTLQLENDALKLALKSSPSRCTMCKYSPCFPRSEFHWGRKCERWTLAKRYYKERKTGEMR